MSAGDQKSIEKVAKYEVGGSLAESVAGGAAVVLSIVGLSQTWAAPMLAVATICVGAALFFQSMGVAKGYWTLLSEVADDKVETIEIGGGMTVAWLAGLAGIALGILSLLEIAPVTLNAVAGIIFGAALIVSSGINAELNELRLGRESDHPLIKRLTRQAVAATAALQVLIGLAAVALGIIALVQVDAALAIAENLCLVITLGVGGMVLLSGSALASRLGTLMRS